MTGNVSSSLSGWRTAATSLAFLLLAVLVAWALRERFIADERGREREQWEADRRLMVQMREEQGAEIVRLDSVLDRRGHLHLFPSRVRNRPPGRGLPSIQTLHRRVLSPGTPRGRATVCPL
jgi:hypothetical protein